MSKAADRDTTPNNSDSNSKLKHFLNLWKQADRDPFRFVEMLEEAEMRERFIE